MGSRVPRTAQLLWKRDSQIPGSVLDTSMSVLPAWDALSGLMKFANK